MEQSKFILEVESRQCLWNPRVDAYFNRFTKTQAWNEIAAKMFPDFNSCTEHDKRKKVTELQKKWKSLRDYYKRRNPKEDIDEITKKKKPIVDLLQFLDKFIDHDKRGRQRVAERIRQFRKSNLVFQLPDYKITVEKIDPYANHSTMPRNKIKKDFSCAKPSLEKNNCQLNEEIMFLQSLLPVMQCLTDRQRFEFKLEVMLLIKKIKYDGTEDDPNNTDNLKLPNEHNASVNNGPTTFDSTPLSIPSVNVTNFKS